MVENAVKRRVLRASKEGGEGGPKGKGSAAKSRSDTKDLKKEGKRKTMRRSSETVILGGTRSADGWTPSECDRTRSKFPLASTQHFLLSVLKYSQWRSTSTSASAAAHSSTGLNVTSGSDTAPGSGLVNRLASWISQTAATSSAKSSTAGSSLLHTLFESFYSAFVAFLCLRCSWLPILGIASLAVSLRLFADLTFPSHSEESPPQRSLDELLPRLTFYGRYATLICILLASTMLLNSQTFLAGALVSWIVPCLLIHTVSRYV